MKIKKKKMMIMKMIKMEYKKFIIYEYIYLTYLCIKLNRIIISEINYINFQNVKSKN